MSGRWNCPICHCSAYQRYGGHVEQAMSIDCGDSGAPSRKPVSIRMGTHFMCKGCSVFFSNPNLFCRENVNKKKDENYLNKLNRKSN